MGFWGLFGWMNELSCDHYGEIGGYSVAELEMVVRVYQRVGSIERTSLHPEVLWSVASVARMLEVAEELGWVEVNAAHRPKKPRERILELKERYPGIPNSQIARLAGCSEATVYRALRGE